MRRLPRIMLAVGASAAAGLGIACMAVAEQKEVIVGQMCDRTGPTQINGVVLCPASHDYYNLINSKGGVEGYQIKSEELDHEYKVPQAVEAYQRMKGDGAVSIMAYGTPQVQALNQKFAEDKIPGTSPGFGIAASADGKRFPYLFPIAATYWSQGAGAIQFVKDKLGGNLEGKKIAYIFYDNPAGREPMPIIEDLQKIEKFELRSFAVPPPGVEIGALRVSDRLHCGHAS
jgi:branched-chain amino acid transport system substrate-binding protein